MKPRFEFKSYTMQSKPSKSTDGEKPKKSLRAETRMDPVSIRATPDLEPLVAAYMKLHKEGKINLSINKLSTKIWEVVLPMIIEAETDDIEAILRVASKEIKKVADEALPPEKRKRKHK